MSQRDFADVLGAFGPQVSRVEDHADVIDEVRALCRAVADYHGHKTVANAIGRKRASLDQALNGGPQANGHRLYLEDLVWFIANEPGQHLLDVLIELRRDSEYTPEERAAAALSAARQYLGSDAQHRGYLGVYRAELRKQRRKAEGEP